MKPLLPLACLFLLASCKDATNTANAKKPIPALAPLQKDSNTVLQNNSNPIAPVDLSPVDIAYYPVDFPISKMTHPGSGLPLARVIYSRPHKQGRTIFGSLLKYGEHWRLGANEATELELFQNATIQNKTVPKGRYILYCIPQADTWTIVFNSNLYSWGLKQDAAHDQYRFVIPVEKTTTPLEFYTMAFEKSGAGANLIMGWDNILARLPITF